MPHLADPVVLHGTPLILANGVTEASFQEHFPWRYDVRALTPFEAAALGKPTDRSWWRFLAPFRYVSDAWGPIDVPEGFLTDFGSVPVMLRSFIDDDAPILLYPSAPHDLLFAPRPDGSRGWLADGRQLTLRQANELLAEAMWYCGASKHQRAEVFLAVEVGNVAVRHTFAKEPARIIPRDIADIPA